MTRYGLLAGSAAVTLFMVSWCVAQESDLKSASAPKNAVWLDSLDLSKVEQGWEESQAGKSVGKNPLTLKGEVYAHGLGTHSESEMQIDLNGSAIRFVSMVGVDDETKGKGSVAFEIWVDGKKVADSGVLHGGDAPKKLSADLTGAKGLLLIVTDAGDGLDHDHADWAGGMILLAPDAKGQPRSAALGADDPPVQIAHGTPPEPRINHPRVVGATPGRPFLFMIPATGEGPLEFAADGLPDGLRLDPQTGIISGSIAPAESNASKNAKTEVALKVKGPRGTAAGTLTIVAGEHQLALTPPMGWNSWNVWACAVDDAKIRAAADAMIKSGLAGHGYQYVNIDDCWELKGKDRKKNRAADGEILTNQKFPDMKALGDYIHAQGLRFGIYSSPGPRTCAGYESSYEYEEQDARTWAKWGVDYVKYDWCSYGEIAPKKPSLEDYQKPYSVMRAALDKCDRDIVFSLCQYGMGDVWNWGEKIGGNLWRTTGDIGDSWSSMSSIAFAQDKCSPSAGPGHWNDPDMLVVGKVGWGPTLHETALTRHEQVTHITLWSLLAAPLLIGCDMTNMDAFTLDLLSNDEVIAVDQDPLGKSALPKSRQGQTEVWARPLADGTIAVGLFNRSRSITEVTAKWSDLGLSGSQPVRDLWQQKDLGNVSGEFKAQVARHGAVLVKIGKPTTAK